MKEIHGVEENLCSILDDSHVPIKIEKDQISISDDQQDTVEEVTADDDGAMTAAEAPFEETRDTCEKDQSSISGDQQDNLTVEEVTADDDGAMTVAEAPFEQTRDTCAAVTFHHSSDHNYFLKENRVPVQHKCDDCGYITNRKNTLINHLNETCQVRRQKGLLAMKNIHCKYCFKKMRHNGLRSHLRHFIKMLEANRKPKGKHSSISQQEFIDYLNERSF